MQEDPFEATQTYVYLTLELSDPLYPVPDTNIIKDNGVSLLAKFGASPEFPSSLDAVKDFDMAVCFVVESVGVEYSKFVTEDEKVKPAGG